MESLVAPLTARLAFDRLVIAPGVVVLALLLGPGCGGNNSRTAPTNVPANLVAPLAARPQLSLVYRVRFEGGSLAPAVDTIGVGAIKLGHTQVADSMPTWQLGGGGLTLGIMRPADQPAVTRLVVAGPMATPVGFAAGTVFGMRAVFAGLAGPHAAENVWAMALVARTGDENQLESDLFTAATLQVRADGARLNTPGCGPTDLPNVPQDVYDALVGGATFRLELVVDRVTGVGNAALYVGAFEVSNTCTFAGFTSTGGPTITAIGPNLAVARGPGRASVRVLDFQVFK
ncbi:MAG: hypothetical protein ABIM89_15435 [Mycobacteriales bacterium]